MKRSDGMSGRAPRSVSQAARFRELRVNRTIYVLSILALVAPWALWFLQLQAAFVLPAAPGYPSTHQLVRQVLMGFATNGNMPFQTVDLFVAAALGLALFGYDHRAGGLLFSLEGPLSRRDVWLAKFLYGGAALVLVTALGTVINLVAAAASGNVDLAGLLVLRALFGATGQLMFFATSLAMGGAMATTFALLTTLSWMGLPSGLQGLAMNLWPTRIPYWMLNLPNFSPFQPSGFAGWSAVAVFALIAWFVAWTALMVSLGTRWWERAAFERLHDGFFFPFLWNLYYAFLSLLSGLILTTVITRGRILGLPWAGLYAGFFVAGWFFWRSVICRHGHRRHAGSSRALPS